MRITALGKPFYNYPKSTVMNKRMTISAPNTMGADIFCFTGSLEKKASIIPAKNDTDLAKKIEKFTQIEPTTTEIKKFKNGEIYVNIDGDVSGKDVYLMPASNENVNDNLMETYLKADAAKRAGAKRVIAVMPSFDYARQEKRTEKGEPIAARLNMELLKASGVDAIITEDLHTPALEGFASNDLHIEHLEAMPLMRSIIKDKSDIKDLVIVSPDLGGTKRADKLAKSLNCDKAIIYKHRQAHNQATAEDLIGDVEGKNCILLDDIIDTAGTITEAAKLLKKKGAKDIYIFASHGLFNGDAMEKIENAPVKGVYVTNSVAEKSDASDKIKYIDISQQIIDTIKKMSDKN